GRAHLAGGGEVEGAGRVRGEGRRAGADLIAGPALDGDPAVAQRLELGLPHLPLGRVPAEPQGAAAPVADVDAGLRADGGGELREEGRPLAIEAREWILPRPGTRRSRVGA